MTVARDSATLRILLAAPRKSGAAHLRCLLAAVYGLAVIDPRGAPPSDDLDELPDGAVLATDRAFSNTLGESASRQRTHLIAILRHPFDLFMSTYQVAQQRMQRGEVHAPTGLEGKSLADPAVRNYLETRFTEQIAWLLDWHASGALIVRYEELIADPAATFGALANRIDPVGSVQIDRALLVCPTENPVRSRPSSGRRMPEVSPGAWREILPPGIQAALMERYGDVPHQLGYAND